MNINAFLSIQLASIVVKFLLFFIYFIIVFIFIDGNPDVNYGSAGINTNSYQNLHQLNGANNKQQNENQQNQLYQNVLDRLTSRVIDISSIEKSCEQADLTDREQAYKDKMMSIRRHVTLPSNANVTITGINLIYLINPLLFIFL